MRLTEKYEDFDIDDDNFEHPIIKHRVIDHSTDYEDKLGQLEDIEEELGIDLVTLFDSKYTSTMYEMELEKDDKTIYFDGDSFYGHYSAKDFLKLIKDMLSMYKQLIKLGR